MLGTVTEQPRPSPPESTELHRMDAEPGRGYEGLDGGRNDLIHADLGVLKHTDRVNVQQTVESVGAGCDVTNTYILTTDKGEQLFLAIEETSCCSRFWCGPARAFRISLRNHNGEDVIRFVRPTRCDACCCPCCMMELMVQTPIGDVIGYVKQTWSLFGVVLKIEDSDKNPLMSLRTSCCPCRCFKDMEVQVECIATDGVGLIRKQWGSRKQDVNMDHETFNIDFPPGLDTKSRVLLIGAAFLMDYMFFEMT
ncbi:phospholipid scramblase 3-like isoform X1 [Asterias amurensis]|uniref:phospholipid scramblase 3-like isoform X1 n=1 Tax=Asterias amurensis TaxID=7602 RepID=UPI003AB91552